MEQYFKYVTLVTSLSIAGVAAYFSVFGLATLFSGAFIPVIIMACFLELGKLVSAAWLHYYWTKINILVKTYLVISVLVLMFITSMGIFGYLTNAHTQNLVQNTGNTELNIASIERNIQFESRKIENAQSVLGQLDSTVDGLLEYSRISGEAGAISIRERQSSERELLEERIASSMNQIKQYESELIALKQTQINAEAKIGPLKHIAEMIYGNSEQNLDRAVRLMIIIVVFVFDPLAIMLLIAATSEFKAAESKRKRKKPLINSKQVLNMSSKSPL